MRGGAKGEGSERGIEREMERDGGKEEVGRDKESEEGKRRDGGKKERLLDRGERVQLVTFKPLLY